MSKQELYTRMMSKLNASKPANWVDIDQILSKIQQSNPLTLSSGSQSSPESIEGGIAFLTFDYGIDGVSIEIAKYAQSLQALSLEGKQAVVHLIGGDFSPLSGSELMPDWRQYHLQGSNGWNKWDNGRWFAKLYYEDMPKNSRLSDEIASEVWGQAVTLSARLGQYIAEHDIALLVPVNISSNPGNFALALCAVIVSESMGIHVLNSNHDFYWEGGTAESQRKQGALPGPRDHFFKNIDNRSFFSLFERIYPWNGTNWFQVNINKAQSARLIHEFEFSAARTSEISTSLSDGFFREYDWDNVRSARLRVAHILSDGQPIIHPISVHQHFTGITEWMQDQKPVVCAGRAGLSLDLTSDEIVYFLQPTRIVARKRIEKDCQLIGALLQFPPFQDEFESNLNRKIVIHITGPAPIEHQADLETVLKAFMDVIENVPDSISDRLFLAFSVGKEHITFGENGFQPLQIEDLYSLATAILFPSETEGRGLPIGEAAAMGIPIICSRYYPEDVFADAVGENLPEEMRILYTHFPEGDLTDSFLEEVTEISFHPEKIQDRIAHNRTAARLRFGQEGMSKMFKDILSKLFSPIAGIQ